MDGGKHAPDSTEAPLSATYLAIHRDVSGVPIWSGPRSQCAQAGESRRRCLSFVVADETVEGSEVDRRCDVDGVQGSHRGLGECSRCEEECAIERQQGHRVDQVAGARPKRVRVEARIISAGSSDRPRNFGQHELARDEIGIGEEGASGGDSRSSRTSFTSADESR